jgi:hypothetical protein
MNEIDTSTLDRKISVMTAFKEGKSIQCRTRGSKDEWTDVFALAWNWPDVDYRIKPLEFPALPEGLEWHNPNNLTLEQVGDGWRLLVDSEVDGESHCGCQYWDGGNGGWSETEDWMWDKWSTIRVPISTPFPEPPKKVVMVPLAADDVLPGSVFRTARKKGWMTPFEVTESGIWHRNLGNGVQFTYWQSLQHCGWEIKRPGEGWKPCEKPAGS